MGKDKALISAIGAVSSNGAIGLDGWLPWDIPEELAYFEKTVAGSALVIGRLTYASMDVVPADSFVVTRQPDLTMRPGCTRVASVEEGLRRALATGKPVFVIGGASLYAAAWPYCDRFYLTRIEQSYVGDSFFPAGIPLDDWPVVDQSIRVLRERGSGREVVCRFMQYAQVNPRCLPESVCNSMPA